MYGFDVYFLYYNSSLHLPKKSSFLRGAAGLEHPRARKNQRDNAHMGAEMRRYQLFYRQRYEKSFPQKYWDNLVEIDVVRKSGDGIGLDGKISKHVWEKVWRMHVYVYENLLNKYEWFSKIDSDTYLFPDNVKHYIGSKRWSSNDVHYFGHKLHHSKPNLISGPGTFFSRKTMQLLGPKLKKMPREYGDRKHFKHGRCVDRDGATEERTVSICLHELGIHAEDVMTDDGRTRGLVWQPAAHLKKKRLANSTGWYWKNKPENAKDGKNCCADDPFFIHPYKTPWHMLDLHKRLVGEKELSNNIEDNYLRSVRAHSLSIHDKQTELLLESRMK